MNLTAFEMSQQDPLVGRYIRYGAKAFEPLHKKMKIITERVAPKQAAPTSDLLQKLMHADFRVVDETLVELGRYDSPREPAATLIRQAQHALDEHKTQMAEAARQAHEGRFLTAQSWLRRATRDLHSPHCWDVDQKCFVPVQEWERAHLQNQTNQGTP
jgi:hypothetical protein